MMHFQSTLFQIFPQFPRNFSDSVENFHKFYLFRKEISIFIRQNFWWLFLVINHKFLISPYFRPFSLSLPLSKKIISPLLLQISPLVSLNFRVFYILSVIFVSLLTLTMMHLCITQCTYWTPLIWLRNAALSQKDCPEVILIPPGCNEAAAV